MAVYGKLIREIKLTTIPKAERIKEEGVRWECQKKLRQHTLDHTYCIQLSFRCKFSDERQSKRIWGLLKSFK